MARAYIIGEKHQILGFKGVGFEIVPVTDAERFADELFYLSRGHDTGLILVTESLAKESPQVIEEFRHRSNAILVIIPTHEGSIYLSINEMRRIVERSMGIDILGKGQTSEQT
jgi:V/A-type H+-transporting ATPase subunit F